MSPKAGSKKSATKKSSTRKSGAKKSAKGRSTGRKKLVAARDVQSGIKDIASQIIAEFPDPSHLLLLGVRTRGVTISERIQRILEKHYKEEVARGILDITLYRDDLSTLGPHPIVRDSEIPFDVTGSQIVLVDDVLYTGRTVRAALDEIFDYGRPDCVKLAVLIDRGCRELPMAGDYIAHRIDVPREQQVIVHLKEIDDHDEVVVATRP